MKLSPTTSRYAAVCLSLFLSYTLLISSVAAFTPKAVYAAPAAKRVPLPTTSSQTGNPSYSTNTSAFVQGANSSPSRDREVLVKFRTDASEHDKNVIALTHNVERKKLKGDSGIEKLRGGPGQSTQSLVLALLQQPGVEFAEHNFLIETNQTEAVVPNDDQFGQQWALRNIGQNSGQYGSDIAAASAWQTTTGTDATVIAVIDSGVDFTHVDLANNQWNNSRPSSEGDLHGWDYVADNGSIKDEQGHGTAIAGIIAAQGNNTTGISGVMWRASLMSLRVLDNTGTGDIGDAVEATDYAVAHGAQVINISWGTYGESLALRDAIERAMDSGVVVVCSTGNGGQYLGVTPYYPASFGLRDLITVGSSDNFDRLSTWSNWGDKEVSIAAPGVDVITTKMGGGYWKVSGTSASAPLVTGVAGLIKSIQPSIGAHKAAKSIVDEARKVASLSGKVSSGGVVNASASLAAVHVSANQRPQTPPPAYGTGGTGPGGTFTTTLPRPTTTDPGANLPNLDQARNARPTPPQAKQPIQSNLVCAECDPQNGGGGANFYPSGDQDFSTARELPRNETGQEGVDPGSRNFNWGLPLVSLQGRAGLDLSLTLYYNSLVWTKDGSFIKYNADQGSPAPGFRLGLPKLQRQFTDAQTGAYAYMMVTPSGGRVVLRQTVANANMYESQDGSYMDLDATNTNAIVVRSKDGTQLTFSPVTINGEYRCTRITDRNGNYISATYNATSGQLQTITDTLGRTITFVYDGTNNLIAIRQTWAGVSHDWATFNYGQVYVAPNFNSSISVNGANNNYVTVLTQVNLHDGTYFTFNYNAAFGQVNKINHYAKDNHLLSYSSYNVDSSAGQTDCPRFTERHDWAENWNNGSEALTYYASAGDYSWSKVTTPDGVVHKDFYATSSWQTGLTITSKVYENASGEQTDSAKKWTTLGWTQDDTTLTYSNNPPADRNQHL